MAHWTRERQGYTYVEPLANPPQVRPPEIAWLVAEARLGSKHLTVSEPRIARSINKVFWDFHRRIF